MFWALIIGFLLGVIAVLLGLYVIICDPFGVRASDTPFVDQFRPLEIPEQLRHFLQTGEDGVTSSNWESTFGLTVLLHLLYQEHKDSRFLRRWLYKRLQLELNDITTRSAAGRLIQDIRIRDLSLGTKVPTINKIKVEKAEMSEDQSTFERVVFLVDLEYAGGFETSIDVQTLLGGYASLSLKVTRLAGNLRVIIARKPYTHWAYSFENTPNFEFEIASQIQGHKLRHIVPLIRDQIRRALQRKHVWPNYKIRYRPVFPNPFLIPSLPADAYSHVKLTGGFEVTILRCSRLKTSLVDQNLSYGVYCTVTLDYKPFSQTADTPTSHSKSTRSISLAQDVIWDQPLHFELDEKLLLVKRHLTVTVHAREDQSNLRPAEPNVNQKDPPKPILLGYTSLYLPQIIDDCRITLSNCHREAFQLKPPVGLVDLPSSNEFSKHPGFDPRLMFGDVTINFRYFPDGLPSEAQTDPNDLSDDEQPVLLPETPQKADQIKKSESLNNHNWKAWSAKQGVFFRRLGNRFFPPST